MLSGFLPTPNHAPALAGGKPESQVGREDSMAMTGHRATGETLEATSLPLVGSLWRELLGVPRTCLLTSERSLSP